VVIPDVTRQHWAVNIRKYVVRADHLNDLVALGSLTPHAAAFLDAAVAVGLNVLVAGSTQAGNPTTRQYTPYLNPASHGPEGHPGRVVAMSRAVSECPVATPWRSEG